MPEPQSGTVRVKMPDGHIWNIPRQNLGRAKLRGATELTEEKPAIESMGKKALRGAALGTAAGLGIAETKTPVQDTLKGLVDSFGTMMGSGAWTGKKSARDVLEANPAVAIPKGLFESAKELYGGGKRGGINPDIEEASHGISSLITRLALMRGAKKVPEVAAGKSEVASATRTGVRAALEVSPEDVAKAREKVEAPVREQKAKFETEKQEARVRNKSVHEASEAEAQRAKAREVAEGQKARVENSRLEGQRQSYEGLQERLSKQTADNLDRAEKMEKMALDADYEDFRKKILGVSKEAPNGTLQANLSPVGEAVLKAKDTIIKGSQTNVPIFKDLMGRFSEMIDEAEGLKPAENQMLTADQLRGYVKELNDKIYASEVPSDVRNAMVHVRDVAENQISAAIKDVHGKAASHAYDALKDRYADYKETWFDKHSGSPVPKIRELLRAPVARNRGIPVYREVGDVLLGKDGEKIMAVLGRKRAFGADTKLIAQLRSTAEKLKALPKPKEVPAVAPREAPNVAKFEAPKPPDFEKFDPEQFVKDTVEGKAKTLQRWGTIGAVSWALRDVLHGRLPSKALLATPGAQFLLKKAMTSPKFQKWLMEGGIEK